MGKASDSVITLVIGGQGGGKSCYSGGLAKEYLRKKVDCYSNYAIRGCMKIKFDELLDLDLRNSVVLLDESAEEYNARNWSKFDRSVYKWFATLRHRNTQVYLFIQNWRTLDVALRELASTVIYLERSPIPHVSIRRIYRSDVSLVEDEDGNATEFKSLFKRKTGMLYLRFLDYHMIDSWYDDHVPKTKRLPEENWDYYFEDLKEKKLHERESSWYGKVVRPMLAMWFSKVVRLRTHDDGSVSTESSSQSQPGIEESDLRSIDSEDDSH